MTEINLTNYQQFVESVTSSTSKDYEVFINRLSELENDSENNINIPLLMTAAIGLAAEGGEFCELPKKIFFQGKPINQESIFHMKRELGDVIFYWVNACKALNLDPNEVIAENIHKLEARYPTGFSVERSEVRNKNDI